jgi:predicted alpha-1,6-mannanase (GH76 family)
MARLAEIGSYEGFVHDGANLLALIFDNIEKVTGIRITNETLRHITIISDDGNRFNINGFPFEIRNNMFCTPSNGSADLMTIREFSSLQDCNVKINYIR